MKENISQRELARLAGLSPNSISLIERDETSPSVATLQSLATALNIRMGYFFEDETPNSALHIKPSDRPKIVSGGVTIEGVGKTPPISGTGAVFNRVGIQSRQWWGATGCSFRT